MSQTAPMKMPLRPRRAVRLTFALASLLLACSRSKPQELASAAPASAASEPAASAPSTPPVAGPLRFLLLGGGPTPESNEVSLEQDVALVQRALPAPGLVLFAGGSASASVRELEPAPRGEPLELAIGDLFAPRAGRQSRYRKPRFAAERATLANLTARLSSALAEPGPPLLLYVEGHGEQGQSPRDNSLALWGGHALGVAQLAELHERHQRPLRLLVTSCFSGGFAELAFAGADAEAGRSPNVARCGLFAGTADRETSGCDPNPNRRAQESYALHVAHALAGTRKDGSPLPLELADFDHDGKIGLLDAHTFARIEAISVDVPTTTSERWLRQVESGNAVIDPSLSPEDRAVVERLGTALGLRNEAAVQQRWSELDQELAELDESLDAADQAQADAAADLATVLLERWPVLDDPFHPDFRQTLTEHRSAIQSIIDASPEARARAEAGRRGQRLVERWGELGVREARVLRLLRAYETQHAAAALLQRGGPDAEQYKSLLACERAAP